jgi:hypothetical protein
VRPGAVDATDKRLRLRSRIARAPVVDVELHPGGLGGFDDLLRERFAWVRTKSALLCTGVLEVEVLVEAVVFLATAPFTPGSSASVLAGGSRRVATLRFFSSCGRP